ncbi:helix-turn-helix domain-containing protein [Jeongeupia sp. USM3]|uniref:helix-turn-helix domain-containing protein n=1 Tax=Jeongeupia sp. USM3 TaxID=1906741 RepID=UPI00089DEFB3|nr:helix-turn-helix transcriptional regulator [Jeongeupia sp. USM3]AOX99673.1 transcriptional regulator [Jeongeupia sp. USM3]
MDAIDVKALQQTIGKAIARRRQATGLTQEQVAERLKIGNEAVSRIERGKGMPTVARLAELAAIFDCDIADLLHEVSPRAQDQAQHLDRLLDRLDAQDRTLVLEIVERLAEGLGKR